MQRSSMCRQTTSILRIGILLLILMRIVNAHPLYANEVSIAVANAAISPGGASPDITSGDTITYRLTITLPEGDIDGLTGINLLPPGFSFQSGMLDTTGFAGSVTLDEVIGDGKISVGEKVTFTFAPTTTVAEDSNPANNSFALLIVARVEGSEAVNDGVATAQSKNNVATLDYTGNVGLIKDSFAIDFVEPDLQITKSMSGNTNLSANDTVTINLVVKNNGTGPAYDVTITDVLNDDGNLFNTFNATEITTPAGFTFNYANPTVTYSSNGTLAAGASQHFAFTVQVRSDVVSGSTFNNQVYIIGESQDGAVTGERSTNDQHTASATTATVVVDKSFSSSSEAWSSDTPHYVMAIGEIVTYQIAVDIPEGITQDGSVNGIWSETLPAGFAYQSGSATLRAVADTTITGSNLSGGLDPIPATETAVSPTLNNQTLTFDLGSLTNNDDDANVEQLILTYEALVLNMAVNNRTDAKNSLTTISYQNKDGITQTVTDGLEAFIGEPAITMTQQITPTEVRSGDMVTITAVLTNQPGTNVITGWEPTITSTVPMHLQNPTVRSAFLSRGNADVAACADLSGSQLSFDASVCLSAADRYLGNGESITVVYTAVISPDAGHEELTNTIFAAVTSLPGTNGTGSATPGAPDSDNGERTGSGSNNTSAEPVNDLGIQSNASITLNKPFVYYYPIVFMSSTFFD